MISWACSTVIPFALRNSAYCSANWSHSSLAARVDDCRLVQVDTEFG